MARLSEFVERLLKKPDITSEEEQWRIRAKMDGNTDYRNGYADCFSIMMHKIIEIENELKAIAKESCEKFRNGAGTYYDGMSDSCWTAIGKLHELVAEVKKHE
jgi:hypothetical protein